MPASIGVNLRVTGNCRQGGRKYMEDCFSVAYQQTEDEKDLEYAFFGIYDGHGGVEAASFAKEHLMETIIKHKNFWSDNDEDVLRAIKDGYIATHYAMWREQSKWPRTSSGLPSTAGTTASVAFIRRGKIYIGHVGDSGIILGYQEPNSPEWKAKALTRDHKPENIEEMKRIESCGGKVVSKSGVPRVVWNRPKIGHQGPVRRSTPIDEIPFLAVARSLGDLWSYNSQINQFVISPDPDCSVLPIDTNVHRCLIFGTDGLFNMLSPAMSVIIVQQAERHNESEALSDDFNKVWLNPSKLLVERALDRWHATKMRADNTSAVTLMLDPPGPPRAQVLKDRKKNLPESGLKIMTRYDQNVSQESSNNQTSSNNMHSTDLNESTSNEDMATPDTPLTSPETIHQPIVVEKETIEEKASKASETSNTTNGNTSISSSDIVSNNYPLKERNCVLKLRESTSFDPREPYRPSDVDKENNTHKKEDNTIQINEISSSNIEESLVEESGNASVVVPNEISTESKCILRSSKKQHKSAEKQGKNVSKRKLDTDECHHQQRKSLRLSLTQRFLDMSKRPAPCTLAEEKLKKLAEEAEKSKQTSLTGDTIGVKSKGECEKNNNNAKDGGSRSRNLNITKRILRSKKINLKKKSLMKNQLNRRKLKVVLETVIVKTSKRLSSKVNDNSAKLLNKKAEKLTKVQKLQVNVNKPIKVNKMQKSASNTDKHFDRTKLCEKTEKSKKKMGETNIVKKEKVVSGKVSNFKRQSVRNASQRPKKNTSKKSTSRNTTVSQSKNESIEKSKKKISLPRASKSSIKESVKKEAKKKEKVIQSSRKPKLQVLNNIKETSRLLGSTQNARSSARVSGARRERDAKENIKVNVKNVNSNSARQKKSLKPQSGMKTTLRQRIQDKTKSLKRTVLKRSR